MALFSESIVELLRERIIDQIRAGTLEYGDRLPSARELSTELDADPRTILAAYHVLAEEDLVELRRRSGVYVAARPSASSALLAPPARWLVDVLTDGIARDISAPMLARRVAAATSTVRTRAVVLECNRDQIHSMCRELREDYGVEADGLELERIERDADALEALRGADVLISGAHGEVVRPLADRLGIPCIITSVRPDLVHRTTRLLARGLVYFVVTDARFSAKLRRLFAPLPGGENFRAIVLGRDDIRSIPSDATTYIMRLASERLEGQIVPGRVVAPVRIFSATCAREILSLVVRRNLAAATDRGD
jgi:DNA-binding transcriptional regulator YhcF (GntR family)